MGDPDARTNERFIAGEYEELLLALMELGYRACSLEQIDRKGRSLFVRHDVDLCPERALQLARREHAIGISATYYFLVTTSLYNVASAQSREICADLLAMGHRIGLHFDAAAFGACPDELEQQARIECTILEAVTGVPVDSISFHRPAREFLNRPGRLAGRRHTYEPEFFSEIGYVSDSNGGWHHGHPLDHPSINAGTALQLLTHPIWWCHSERLSAAATVHQFRSERISGMTKSLKDTVKAYRQHPD
jgi:hypothetical protein